MERIVKQVKMLKIYARASADHRDPWEKIYYIGKFISEEDTQTRLELAKKKRDIEKEDCWGVYLGNVKTDTWWENVEIL